MAVTVPKRRSIAVGMTALSTTTTEDHVSIGRGLSATVNGLEVEGSPSLEACGEAGKRLRVIEKGAQFAIGDWVLYLEERFGEAAAQVLDPDLGWSLKTLGVYKWMAERIPRDIRRMDRLGVQHHMAVAPLTHERQRHWLTLAAADAEEAPWTVARLKAALEAGSDQPESAWFVIVSCPSGQVQSDLMDRLEREGLSVKARTSHVRRRRREPEPELAEV